MNAIRRHSIAAIAFAVLAATPAVRATTYTYKYVNNTSWYDSSVWSPYGTPTTADTAVFPSVFSGGGYDPYFVNLGLVEAVGTLQIDTHGVFSLSGNANYPLTVTSVIRDYVGQSGTPAPHSISLDTLYSYGAIEVGSNANLTISSKILGAVDKRGPGTLSLIGKSTGLSNITVEAGTLALYNDPIPFTSSNYPAYVNAGATINLATSGAMTRPIRGADASSGVITITALPGITPDLTNGISSSIPVNISGGGSIHSSSVQFISSTLNTTRIPYLNIDAGTTLSVDSISGNPSVFLNNSTLKLGGDVHTLRSTEVLAPNGTSTIDTGTFTYTTAQLQTALSGVTLNKAGSGTLAVDGGSMSGFAVINLTRGTLKSSFGGTAALNLGNATTLEAVRSETAATSVHILGNGIVNVDAGNTVVLNGVGLSGSGQLDAWGAGTLRLQTGVSPFDGNIDVDKGGRVELQTAGWPTLHYVAIEPGSSAAILAPNQINTGGTFAVYGALDVNTPDLGTAPFSPASTFALYDGGTLRFRQSINTAATRNIYVDAGNNETISVDDATLTVVPGILRNGGGTLTKAGGGTLMLQGNNTLAGKIRVAAGSLILDRPFDGSSATLPAGTSVDVLPGTTVMLGWYPGDNNVVGGGYTPDAITPFNLLGGTLTTAEATTHNLGAVHITNGHLWGSADPLSGFGDYTLNSAVTFDPSAGDGMIDALGGVTLRGSIAFDTAASASRPLASLNVTAVIGDEPGSIGTLIKRGDGRLTLTSTNTYTGGTQVEAGTLIVMPTGTVGGGPLTVQGGHVVFAPGGSGVQHLNALTINPAAIVDLADRKIIVDAGGISLDAVRAALAAGTLTSSAASDGQSLAYASRDAVALQTFGDATLTSSQVLIGLTASGDATFDGTVGFGDLLALARHYGSSTAVWTDGDFNYDGAVNFTDLLTLARNYGRGTAAGASTDMAMVPASIAVDWALAQALAPEPTTTALVALGFIAGVRRRR